MKREEFSCQGKAWTRRETYSGDVCVKVRNSGDADNPQTVSVWIGPHILENDAGEKIVVSRSAIIRTGKSTTLTYIQNMPKKCTLGELLAPVLEGTGYRLVPEDEDEGC